MTCALCFFVFLVCLCFLCVFVVVFLVCVSWCGLCLCGLVYVCMCVFCVLQEEYGAEGLDVASIPFRDNQNIIDLIAKRPAGLMPILEDQVGFGRFV